jgi:hypothetical protein
MIAQNFVESYVSTVVADSFEVDNQESRVREALGIAYGALPEVQTSWLRRYHEYLSAKLVFPFEAEYVEDIAGYRQLVSRVTVVGLLHPDQHGRHEDFGLLCRVQRGDQEIEVPLADIELRGSSPNFQLVEDYWYWFWNWRFDPKI